MPPVSAYHLILTAYGFWLPNDPRGSWSDFVRAWELRRFGPATKVRTRQSVAGKPRSHANRLLAKRALARAPVSFDGHQALAVAQGFGHWTGRSSAMVYACAILPEHVHLVVARHALSIEEVANQLKGAATRRLIAENRHPFRSMPYKNRTLPSPWARKCWKVFLTYDSDIQRAVEYVERNPTKEGKRRQRWPFVRPFLPAALA